MNSKLKIWLNLRLDQTQLIKDIETMQKTLHAVAPTGYPFRGYC